MARDLGTRDRVLLERDDAMSVLVDDLAAGAGSVLVVVLTAGFSHFRRPAETPFNLVFEARP